MPPLKTPTSLLNDELHISDSGKLDFEAPLDDDADIQPYSASAKKHFSIDFSLELERQLDLESLPSTPAYGVNHHLPPTPKHLRTRQPESPTTAYPHNRDGPDPHVLSHIVTQLRDSLSAMTKERDDLLAMISKSTEQEAQLKDALQHMTDKATGMEEELTEARKRMLDDADAIKMLRAKVDESRRGLMQLQTQNRRQSVQGMTLDLSRAGVPAFGAPPSSKRASFTPLTGASMGDPQVLSPPSAYSQMSDALSPPLAGAKAARRISGFFGRGGSPEDLASVVQDVVVVENLKKEVLQLKTELDETKAELAEATEANEASETCVKALRMFIEDNQVGKVRDDAPLPSATNDGDKSASGWGFKLWKVDTTGQSMPPPASPSMHARALSMSSAPSPTVTTPTGQFAKKLGGFFGARNAVTPAATPTIPEMTPSPRILQRDSIYSASDASSVVEPVSPTSDMHYHNVMVRDSSSVLSDSGSPPGIEATQIKQPVH